MNAAVTGTGKGPGPGAGVGAGAGEEVGEEAGAGAVTVTAGRFEVHSQLTVSPDTPEFSCTATSQCVESVADADATVGEAETSSGVVAAASYLCKPLSFYTCVW